MIERTIAGHTWLSKGLEDRRDGYILLLAAAGIPFECCKTSQVDMEGTSIWVNENDAPAAKALFELSRNFEIRHIVVAYENKNCEQPVKTNEVGTKREPLEIKDGASESFPRPLTCHSIFGATATERYIRLRGDRVETGGVLKCLRTGELIHVLDSTWSLRKKEWIIQCARGYGGSPSVPINMGEELSIIVPDGKASATA